MTDQFSRTRMLLGGRNMEKLANARVAVIGLGGVGSYALEALARSGVGAFELVDGDMVSLTNLNRQILALHSTLGQRKTDAAEARAKDINPAAAVRSWPLFVTAENIGELPLEDCDYIVDAIDTVSAKIALILRARELGVPIISSMGTGNKLDPSALRVADLAETSGDPLARVMRKELRRRGVEHVRVLFSTELPHVEEEGEETKGEPPRPVPGSVAFVPSAAGLMIAGEVIRDLCARE
ncbi:MAG: tRNA threonylcarbamoyladenosine dehydratase [Oscillospiraceae bacterium]|nr:tRNA threonylcarbamoyladenosine dehydratase [Oscillospiraceae bacterium]